MTEPISTAQPDPGISCPDCGTVFSTMGSITHIPCGKCVYQRLDSVTHDRDEARSQLEAAKSELGGMTLASVEMGSALSVLRDQLAAVKKERDVLQAKHDGCHMQNFVLSEDLKAREEQLRQAEAKLALAMGTLTAIDDSTHKGSLRGFVREALERIAEKPPATQPTVAGDA